jgi:hypothetical protein
MSKRVKIFNPGGAGWQTKVMDAETGEEMLDLSHIEIGIDLRGMPTATIYTFIAPEVDITVNAEVKQVCPCCRQVIEHGQSAPG